MRHVDELMQSMQRQPELPYFAAHLCGIPAEAVTELNLSLRDEGVLGGVRGSDDIKHIQYMGRGGIRADVNMFQRVLSDSRDNAMQWEHWKLL